MKSVKNAKEEEEEVYTKEESSAMPPKADPAQGELRIPFFH